MSIISKWLNKDEAPAQTASPPSIAEPPQADAPQAAAAAPARASAGPLDAAEKTALEEDVVAALKTCYDPEIPVDIYELGLIYDIDIDKERFVTIQMTLTSPGCPVAGSLPGEVERKVSAVDGVLGARVELVWEPPWTMEQMSEEARLDLGFY